MYILYTYRCGLYWRSLFSALHYRSHTCHNFTRKVMVGEEIWALLPPTFGLEKGCTIHYIFQLD